MWNLVPIFFIAAVCLWLTETNSVTEIGPREEKVYVKKEKIFFIIMALSMAVFVGLRYKGNDTDTYLSMYNNLNTDFSDIDWSIGSNPGFWVVNKLLKSWNLSGQSFLMFYAVITECIYLWFIRKYSENIWLSVFLFMTMGVYTFAMAAIKQTFAVALSLVGIDFFLRKKRSFFVLFIVLASFFHPYSLMFFIVPFLNFSPWTSRTKWLIVIAFGAGLSMSVLVGTLISVTSMMGEEFDEASMQEAGVNIFRVMAVWAPIVLSFFVKDELSESKENNNNLFFNLTTINACIMFIGLFGTANYFARLANYFLIFQTLSIPWLLNFLKEELRKTILIVLIVGYSIFFIYDALFAQAAFDDIYGFKSFFDYIGSGIYA